MSNSPLVTYTKLSSDKSTRKSKIDSVIIHCIVGQWTAKEGCDYFASTERECSANYVVGKDGSIGLSVEEKYRAWCSGGTDKNGNPIRVNGISGADFDHRAIAIEVASDTKHPYAVTDAAYKALINLLVDICQRNDIKALLWKGDKKYVGKIDMQNMGAHRWFANKACPGDYLYSRMGQIASEVNKRLGSINTSAEPEKPATGDSGVLYRVQTGAFSKKANADAMLAQVKAKGFDTYMVKVGKLYKIQVGAFAQKSNAISMASKLKAAGFSTYITTEQGQAVAAEKKTVDEIAREVIQGKWGNGADRKKRLEAAGYNYAEVQAKVNKLL